MTVPEEVKFSTAEEAAAFFSALTFNNIAGLDECGRGPYAGPVVAACVLLPENHNISGIRDSKKLTAKRREKLAQEIMDCATWGIGARSSVEVDEHNIREATFQAATDAFNQCFFAGAPIDFLLCDGGLHIQERIAVPTTSIVKGDFWYECISAASIIAKVYRDTQMSVYHEVWPEYGFITNQGYGTKFHLEAIKKYGITPIHRRSYGAVREYLKGHPDVQV